MTLNLDRSSWQTVQFGDVVRNVNENLKDPASAGVKRVLGLEHLDPGELRIQRWGDVGPEWTFTRRVRPGQTLFGKRRAYQRKTAYAEFDAVCSGDILVFESADPARLLPELLPFIAMTDAFYAMALETSAGSLSPRTRWSDIAKYEFELPPLDQQGRIATLLWAAHHHANSLDSLASVLSSLYDHQLQQVVGLAKPTVKLTDVVEILDSQRIPVNEDERQRRPGSVPYFGAGGQVGSIDEALFDEPLVLVGEDATLAVYRIDGPSWVNNHAHVLRPVAVSQDWLYYALSWADVRRFATNGTRLKLTRGSLERLTIPMPEDIDVRTARMKQLELVAAAAVSEAASARLLLTTLVTGLLGSRS